MIDATIKLFAEADALFYILFSISLLLLAIEAIIPSFGIIGLGGILMAFGAITARCVTGNNTSKEIFVYIGVLLAIIVVLVVIVKLLNRIHKAIKRSKNYLIVDGVKVPLTKEGTLDYSFLLGKEGEVVSDLKPTGKVKIDGNVFEVTTTKGYLYTGTLVKVDKVVGQKIIVRKKGS